MIEIVDDYIPVDAETLEPIWGTTMMQAWQIILIKLWAKLNGGYREIHSTPPFDFLEHFSNPNWKFFNLQKEGTRFLANYTEKKQDYKIVLKTKATNIVYTSGLVPDTAAY